VGGNKKGENFSTQTMPLIKGERRREKEGITPFGIEKRKAEGRERRRRTSLYLPEAMIAGRMGGGKRESCSVIF